MVVVVVFRQVDPRQRAARAAAVVGDRRGNRAAGRLADRRDHIAEAVGVQVRRSGVAVDLGDRLACQIDIARRLDRHAASFRAVEQLPSLAVDRGSIGPVFHADADPSTQAISELSRT